MISAYTEQPFYTAVDLQNFMGVGESTVAKWCRRKEITYFEVGKVRRFARSAVVDFVIRKSIRARGVDEHGNRMEISTEQYQLLCQRVAALLEDRLVNLLCDRVADEVAKRLATQFKFPEPELEEVAIREGVVR